MIPYDCMQLWQCVQPMRECTDSADMLCRVCACMQTQHKVQLDARDKGQAPAGQPGPYQVTPPSSVLSTAFVFNVLRRDSTWLPSQVMMNKSSSKQISFACPVVKFRHERHAQLPYCGGVWYADVMQWHNCSSCSPLSCYHPSDAGTHAAGHTSPRGSGAVWACSRLRLPPSGLPSVPKHGGQPSRRLPYPGKQMLTT